MEGFGIEKLSLVLVIVLVLFGAKRVPEIGASIGKGIRDFKRGISDLATKPEDADVPVHRIASATAPNETAEGDAEPKRLLERQPPALNLP